MLSRRERRIIRINKTENSPTIATLRKTETVSEYKTENCVYEGVSICLTAWKTYPYIEECLDSIYAQTYFTKTDNFEVLVGVDACKQTLQKLKQIAHKYRNLHVYYTEKNVGTYILTNTMMNLATKPNLIRFDTDDKMRPNMIETCMSIKKDADFVMFKMRNFPGGLTMRAYGQHLITKEAFLKFGGYMPWRCGADHNMMVRMRAHAKVVETDLVLLDRRIHSNNITKLKETSYNSKQRKENGRYTSEHAEKEPFIDLTICKVEEISF